MFLVTLWCMHACTVESAVLDPSLYLSPGPPLTDTSAESAPAALWSRSARREIAEPDIPTHVPEMVETSSASQKSTPGVMERARLFWPPLRTHYRVGAGNIHIPLTFSLTGMYGPYPENAGTSMIGSSYGTVSEIGGTSASALAGNRFGNYRTYSGLRIYGGENGPAWSGWGNGKWGHYGKG